MYAPVNMCTLRFANAVSLWVECHLFPCCCVRLLLYSDQSLGLEQSNAPEHQSRINLLSDQSRVLMQQIL